jgi:Fe-S oxidoreductase
MWMEVPGERLAEKRIQSAFDVGAEVIVSACPFCLSTLEDAVLTAGLEGSIEVMDIAKIVAKAL